MSESIFQNSGCVNTILGSMVHLSSFLPVRLPINLSTTINHKYHVLDDVAPLSMPKLQYFGIGTKGYYCTATGSNTSHVKLNPDARNMDIYQPIPIRIVPISEDLSWEERKQYRMRVVGTDGYIRYYLKKIKWSEPEEIEIREVASNGVEDTYDFDPVFLNPPVPTAAQVGGSELTSSTRIIVRAIGTCKVTMTELANTLNLQGVNYAEISEFGFYTGCEVFVSEQGGVIEDPLPEDDELIDGAVCIESVYTQLAKHKTQLPITLQDENSVLETTVSFESSNSISI